MLPLLTIKLRSFFELNLGAVFALFIGAFNENLGDFDGFLLAFFISFTASHKL